MEKGGFFMSRRTMLVTCLAVAVVVILLAVMHRVFGELMFSDLRYRKTGREQSL